MLSLVVIINMFLSPLYISVPSFIAEDSAEGLSIGINTIYKFFALGCCCCILVHYCSNFFLLEDSK